MKNNSIFSVLCVVLTTLLLASCSGKGKQTSCTYYLYCSQDLLQYATPEITYLTSTGAEKTILLDEQVSRSEFVNGIVRKGNENIVVAEDTMKLVRFSVNVLATGWTHTYEAIVKYIPTENTDNHDALMYHCLNADYKVVNTSNGYEQSKGYYSTTRPEEINSFAKFSVNAGAVGSYITNLSNSPDYFTVTITDGIFGNVTDKISE